MRRLIIVGGGNSVREGISTGLWRRINIRNLDIMGINSASLKMGFCPDIAVWLDNKPTPHSSQQTKLLPCLRFTKENPPVGVPEEVYQCRLEQRAEKFPGCLANHAQFVGKRVITGIFALSLAIYLKYKKIYLLGFDWTPVNGLSDWYQEKDTTGIWLKGGQTPHEDIKEHDVFKGLAEIKNVSPESKIPSFPKISYEQFYREI